MKNVRHFVTPEKTKNHAEILSNRVRNRYKHLRKRFKRAHIDVFRLYDRDIPEVRAVVDWYKGYVVMGEYVRLQTGPEWLPKMAEAVANALEIPRNHVFIKRRSTHSKSGPRYQTQSTEGKRLIVNERDLRFWVNLDGQVDTGLFSDHRETRVLFKDEAKNKDVLNVYAYTGAFSCAAALGGAKSVVTVDRSSSYIQWAKENFKLNNLSGRLYKFTRSDTEQYLDELAKTNFRFSLAMVDPPSFSQRRGSGVFDINHHHPELLEKVKSVMVKNGVIYFSTNHQRFDPKLKRLSCQSIEELTPRTVPEDYRNKLVHRCWRIVV